MVKMSGCGTVGRGFEPWLRPRCHQCLWIRLMATSTWVKVAWLPCHIHAYTVYTSIGGKGRCRTRCDLWDHCTQARKSAGERYTQALKPVRKDTQSPKQEQSVAPQTGPWSNKKKKKKKKDVWLLIRRLRVLTSQQSFLILRFFS